MADKLKVVSYGKQLIGRIRFSAAKDSAPPTAFTLFRKGVHTTTYDKNIDEAIVQSTMVPDKVIGEQPETYWVPHPHTSVFEPVNSNASPVSAAGTQETVVSYLDPEQKVWFRQT